MKRTEPNCPAQVRGGVFVSDLHLFSPRSAADQIHRQLFEFSANDQCIVLGGDIFDFRWSTHASHSATLQAALGWLENLLAGTGNAQIQFLPGNHDCHPDLLNLFSTLAEREPRFGWHIHHVQVGNCLFLHGDILDAKGCLTSYRKKFQHTLPQTQLAHRAYDAIVGARLHKLVPWVRHQSRATCQRLWNAVQAMSLDDQKNVEKVFFGHTHVPVHGQVIDEVQFYNPGAALKHMRAHIEHFAFDELTSLAE